MVRSAFSRLAAEGFLGSVPSGDNGAPLEGPVWVDLLTGRVYAFPKQDMLIHSGGVTFVNVPVYDSPCLLTERRVALP